MNFKKKLQAHKKLIIQILKTLKRKKFFHLIFLNALIKDST